MQRVYFLGFVNEISQISFDFYNKLRESFYIDIFDKDNNENFKIKISGNFCEYVYKKVQVSDLVYAICNVTNVDNKEIVYNLEYIQVL